MSVSNCLNFGILFKASVGSINGSSSEGNIITSKKVTLPNGSSLPYVSGQSLRRMIRERWSEMGEAISDLQASADDESRKKAPEFSAGRPDLFIDDDLMGYLLAETVETRRRTGPVRVASAVGIFPYQGDRDYGTRSKSVQTDEGGQKLTGNIFETEIYYNVFRSNILVELDRIGQFQPFEIGKKTKGIAASVPPAERIRRTQRLAEAIVELWGGGKQSRFLTDISPKFLIYSRQSRKNPIFLESLQMSEDDDLIIEPLLEAVADHKGHIQRLIVGIRSGFISEESRGNLSEQLNNLGLEDRLTIGTVGEAGEAIQMDISGLYTSSGG